VSGNKHNKNWIFQGVKPCSLVAADQCLQSHGTCHMSANTDRTLNLTPTPTSTSHYALENGGVHKN